MNLVPLPPRKAALKESRRSLVLSSHFAMERNLRGLPFPDQADNDQREEVLARVAAAVEQLPGMLHAVPLGNDPADKEDLWMEIFPQEPETPETGPGTMLYLGEAFGVRYVIGVNQGSHVKIWASTTLAVWEPVSMILDRLSALLGNALEWAFRPDLGYLTADPDRLGTGLGIWVLMHLPGLTMQGQIQATARGLSELGFGLAAAHTDAAPYRIGPPAIADEVRSGSPGSLYFLHNLRSGGRGFSEEMLLNVMHTQTLEMLGHEWAARQKAIEEDPREAVDRVSRSAALLQNAYLLSYTEALDAVSALIFGAEAGILPVRRPEALAPLHLDLLPYRLRRRFGGTDVSHRLRAARATVARAAIREAGPPSRPRTAESSDKT